MLNPAREDSRSNSVVIRTLTDEPSAFPMCLGCSVCTARDVCGGLSVEASIEDCLALCCGNPDTCNRVCKNHRHKFVDQVREIGGFRLRDVPRAPAQSRRQLPPVIPLIYHGNGRQDALDEPVVALRLADLVNYVTGTPRFSNRDDLNSVFRISDGSRIVLTGVNFDERIEPWWSLGTAREAAVQNFIDLGVELVSTPNYSVVLDHPRYDDLHSIKRIGLDFSDFQSKGLACALHPNGRTERDFERWSKFIRERDEIEILSYEFITGPSRKARKPFHLEQLARIAEECARPLDIIVRGDPEVIPSLRQSFRSVSYIETTGFVKAIKRQRAQREGNNRIIWSPAPTLIGTPIDELMRHNLSEHKSLLTSLYFGNIEPFPDVA